MYRFRPGPARARSDRSMKTILMLVMDMRINNICKEVDLVEESEERVLIPIDGHVAHPGWCSLNNNRILRHPRIGMKLEDMHKMRVDIEEATTLEMKSNQSIAGRKSDDSVAEGNKRGRRDD